MSRPFGVIAARPTSGPVSPPYQGLSETQQQQAIQRAKEKRERKAFKRLAR